MTRRGLLAGFAASVAWAANPAQEVWETIGEMAAALGRASAGEFLAFCDGGLAGYETLRASVAALTATYEVESGMEPVSNTGDARVREVEIDWQMQLIDRTGLGRVTGRRQVVKCRLELRGRKWKVVSMEPLSFFSLPSA